jgi:hypothetical protein
MPDHRKLLLISVLVLMALLFVGRFLVYEYLPERIPGTSINITGLSIVLSYGFVQYVVFKRILKQDDSTGLFYLIIFGSLIVLFSELIFQTYRQTTYIDMENSERLRIFFIGVLGMSAYAAVLGFLIAFQLKYKKGWITTLLTVGIVYLFYLASPYILSFIRGE